MFGQVRLGSFKQKNKRLGFPPKLLPLSPLPARKTQGAAQAQLHSVREIAASSQAFCAIRDDGSVVTWGNKASNGGGSGAECGGVGRNGFWKRREWGWEVGD